MAATMPTIKSAFQFVFGVKDRSINHSDVPPIVPQFPPTYARSWFQDAGQAIHDGGFFVGCPLELFELTARDPLCVALIEGLRPDSTVLEIGCGCLRVGYWLIQHLDPGHYCGIEPNTAMLDMGRERILGQLEPMKRPRFGTNDQFDFNEFGMKFDMVIAYSIWSHASKPQISAMLEGFKAVAKPGGKFLASWNEPRSGMADYQGATWVGRSHDSDVPGSIAHTQEWLETAANSRGLGIAFFDRFTTISQRWVVISQP